jgi:hypothetical protein
MHNKDCLIRQISLTACIIQFEHTPITPVKSTLNLLRQWYLLTFSSAHTREENNGFKMLDNTELINVF